MHKYRNIFFLLCSFCILSIQARATHCMGGEISWTCTGNHTYVFRLIFYRDCNGFEVSTNYETIEVWGHPTVTSFKVNFEKRVDISPVCTAAAGSIPYTCGTGVGGGNGVGAIEKIVYKSDPIVLTGTPPPSDGWHFTYQSFSRNGQLTNIANPTTVGITIAATMYSNPNPNSSCLGDSPIFLQPPYIVTCAGEPYEYNPNAIDSDLDSLHFSWGKPLDYFPTGSYNPPTNPTYIPFSSGYSYNNPTPDQSFNPSNVPASIDPNNGKITFTSYNTGAFNLKIKVDAYRDGKKIATVFREMEVIVQNCNNANNMPVITPPFAGGTSFDTTIYAGDLVSFDLDASDLDQLQDGTSQSVSISSTGLMYGTNYTNPSAGCTTPDCATLNTPSITGTKNASLHFNWQTNCSHLKGANGIAKNIRPYYFVFKVKDDYCSAPKTRYVTVTINVKNKGILPAPEITCVTTEDNGDVTLHWTPINDPSGSFQGYEIRGINSDSITTISSISTSSYTIDSANIVGGEDGFFIATSSGCGGQTIRYSDTIANIFLDVNNPNNGTAVLNWNKPVDQLPANFGEYYYIYKEYPAGNWTLLDSVPYGLTHYIDTIMVCQAFINYRIKLPTSNCIIKSNINGDIFEDMIVPDIPTINSVTIDTLTGKTTISWNVNGQEDTYGYVVYKMDENNNLVPFDTIIGILNTSYTYYEPNGGVPHEYSVVAFDSCYTNSIPPTHHTSGKAQPHTTMLLSSSIDICSRKIQLNWTEYIGFDTTTYSVFKKINQGSWQDIGTTSTLNYVTNATIGDTIFTVIQARSPQNRTSFSNVDTTVFKGSSKPDTSYLSVATVQGKNIIIKHHISLNDGIAKIRLERYNSFTHSFEKIEEKPVVNNPVITFVDKDVKPTRKSYTYRTDVIDTCGHSVGYSNIGQTVFLHVITDQNKGLQTLQWTPYRQFIGNTISYSIYRAIKGDNFTSTPIATVPYNIRTYTDTVNNLLVNDDGKVCYKVVARQGPNLYGDSANSTSNIVCGVVAPLIYIPNTFTPDGDMYNQVFKPVTQNRKITNYHFVIFDRFGNVLFSTTDPEKGWDGRLKKSGKIAKVGLYVYHLSLRDGNNREVSKWGHVTLLR